MKRPDLVQEAQANFIKAGADIIDGCCGVWPSHIAAISNMFSAENDAFR